MKTWIKSDYHDLWQYLGLGEDNDIPSVYLNGYTGNWYYWTPRNEWVPFPDQNMNEEERRAYAIVMWSMDQ